MPYRYNEKTGEFEDVPGMDKSQHRPQAPRMTTPNEDSGSSFPKVLGILVKLLLFAIISAVIASLS